MVTIFCSVSGSQIQKRRAALSASFLCIPAVVIDRSRRTDNSLCCYPVFGLCFQGIDAPWIATPFYLPFPFYIHQYVSPGRLGRNFLKIELPQPVGGKLCCEINSSRSSPSSIVATWAQPFFRPNRHPKTWIRPCASLKWPFIRPALTLLLERERWSHP
jgi:hypothetical protein